jgi:hypothetical protein
MKTKIFALLILISGFLSAQVTFNPGIRAGVNFANLTNRSNETFYLHEDENPEKVTHTSLKTVTDFILDYRETLDLQNVMLCNRKLTIPDREPIYSTLQKTEFFRKKDCITILSEYSLQTKFISKISVFLLVRFWICCRRKQFRTRSWFFGRSWL